MPRKRRVAAKRKPRKKAKPQSGKGIPKRYKKNVTKALKFGIGAAGAYIALSGAHFLAAHGANHMGMLTNY